jgi:GH18 family chitinase
MHILSVAVTNVSHVELKLEKAILKGLGGIIFWEHVNGDEKQR